MRASLLLLLALNAEAQVQRTFVTLPSSNGHGAVMADVSSAKVVHFRERLPATEEHELDAQGNDLFVGNQPQVVKTRDLLFDAYLGLRVAGQQRWLSTVPADVPASGYETAGAPRGGSGMVTWKQQVSGLEVTTWVFAPRTLPHAGFVLALRVKNPGAAAVTGVSAFSLHNFRLGYGRPGPMTKLAANGETVVVGPGRDILERAFAGVVVSRPLGPVAHAVAWNGASPAGQNGFQLVQGGGATDFPDSTGDLGVADDWASAFQFDLGTIAAGAEAWAALTVAHHADPFGGPQVQAWLDAYVAGRTPKQLVDDERAGWSQFQQSLTVPAGLSADEEAVFRQSAVMLAMAQVREREAFLREWLASDGQPRKTRFRSPDGGTVTLPGTISHRGAGAVLASLPPGEWTYAWVRDGAYSAAALSRLGLTAEAREALRFILDAESGRFGQWNELKPYAFPPYVVSLTRYTGFGVEETDFNAFGPNLELDGFGLVLWALREHERRTGDFSLTDAKWTVISTRIADALVALIDPVTGLVRKDSSIWETHWLGRERSWAYTNITAVRGLCDAAVLAERKGDATRATQYRAAGNALRKAIATRLVDATGVVASNLEELESGAGYLDAAALDAIAMGLFAPDGRIARATLAAFDQKLRATAGPGWSRNDDRSDHSGKTDLSPWGSEYDSAEWVFTDLRGAIALRRNGNPARADALLTWITSQSAANAQVIPETFDEQSGAWKFNAPMIGFGARLTRAGTTVARATVGRATAEWGRRRRSRAVAAAPRLQMG
ncbi:MAG: glucosyl hydrolase family protein [Myxococcaceae bacterium]|nr:glucosyl hydrolase family protein [Myxococcaceae bacterium]